MASETKKFKGLSRELIALRIANELEDGSYVNLGIGIPTLVSDWIEGRDIVLQAELGMLNTGPLAPEGGGQSRGTDVHGVAPGALA